MTPAKTRPVPIGARRITHQVSLEKISSTPSENFNTGSAFGYTPAAATGAAVRTLVEIARDAD